MTHLAVDVVAVSARIGLDLDVPAPAAWDDAQPRDACVLDAVCRIGLEREIVLEQVVEAVRGLERVRRGDVLLEHGLAERHLQGRPHLSAAGRDDPVRR